MFAAPTFAVQGLRRIDRRWIDGEIERGIAACGWQRPTTKDPALQIEPKAKPS